MQFDYKVNCKNALVDFLETQFKSTLTRHLNNGWGNLCVNYWKTSIDARKSSESRFCRAHDILRSQLEASDLQKHCFPDVCSCLEIELLIYFHSTQS